MTSLNRQKYRPYFSAQELSEIICALKESPSPSRIKLIQYLETFNLKITHGIISSQYTSNPLPTIEQKLGFEDLLPDSHDFSNSQNIPKLDPKTARFLAYTVWTKTPQACTVKELNLVNEYRYENGLMSQQEQVSFEKSLGLSA